MPRVILFNRAGDIFYSEMHQSMSEAEDFIVNGDFKSLSLWLIEDGEGNAINSGVEYPQ